VSETSDTQTSPAYPSSDVSRVVVDGREFIVVGTAHISRESADLVREVIESERPDAVCIELDADRYRALSERDRFESLDLKQVIRNKQLSTLILNLILASYQKQLGVQLGVMPGTELLEAAHAAEQLGLPISLCDRDVRITLRRAWASLTLWRKALLLGEFIEVLFERPELNEDDLRELRQQDVVSKVMQELGQAFPSLKKVLIDERDSFLAEKVRETPGQRLVAVVGAGHVEGIRKALLDGSPVDLEGLSEIPPVSPLWKVFGWSIPALIIGSIVFIGWQQGAAAAGENALFWFLVTGVPSLIGAILALAHPLTALTAFVAAPFTTLSPVIGAGHVAAFAQTYFRPPLVRELRSVSADLASPRQWWRNRLLRIFLVFLLTTLGASFGTFVGGAKIVSNLFG
jgi:pheromone shutdown-related protein TraB